MKGNPDQFPCASDNARMKLQQLRYLVALGAEGSIRAAARALGLAQATVTEGLRELEHQAGVALLDRRGRGVRFTAAGEELLVQAQAIVGQVRRAEDSLARHRGGDATQRLAVGVTPWVAQTLLAPVVSAFRAELPQVRLEFVDGFSALAYPRLRDGSLDLMIGRIGAPAVLQGLHAEPLFRYEMTVVARPQHPLAQAQSLAELLDSDWVINYAPAEARTVLHDLFGRHGLTPPRQRIQLAHSGWLILALLRAIDVLTFWPWPLLEASDVRHELVALNLRERFAAHDVGIVRRAQQAPGLAAARFMALFLDHVRAEARSDDPRMRRLFYTLDLLPAASG